MKRYAFFDVDGTVIDCDSFRFIALRVARRSPWRFVPAALLLPLFLATYFFKLDRRYAKSALLWCATVGRGRRATVRFLREEIGIPLQKEWRIETNETLARLRSEGHQICYVSASGQLWLRALLRTCDPGPKRIIGSRLGFRWGGVMLTSPNCYEAEKIKRIGEALGSDLIWEAAYSDHPADLPLLLASRRRFVVSPKPHHEPRFRAALGNTFEILRWNNSRK